MSTPLSTQISTQSYRPAMAAFIVVTLVTSIDVGMMYTALAIFIQQFGDPERVGWLLSITLLVSASSAAVGGRLGDIYGRKRLLLIALGVVSAGSMLSGASDQFHWVLAGRALQGVAGVTLPLCYGLVKETMPRERVTFAVSAMTSVSALGGGFGSVIGGIVIDHWSWHWLFHITAAGAMVAVVLVFLFVSPTSRISVSKADSNADSKAVLNTDTKASTKRLDILGGVLFVPAIVVLLLAVTQAKIWGWSDQRILLMLSGSVVTLAIWVWYELRHADPLIDVRLLGNRQIGLAILLMVLTALGPMQSQLGVLLMQQPLWTGVGLGVSATLAGLLRLPPTTFGFFGAIWSGRMTARHGARQSLLYSLIVMTAGWIILTLFHANLWIVVGSMLFSFFGITAAFSAAQNLIIEAAPAHRTSEVSGLAAVARFIAQGIGAHLLALTLASSVVSDPAHGSAQFPSSTAYFWTFGLVTLCCLLCLPVVLALPRHRSLRRPPDQTD